MATSTKSNTANKTTTTSKTATKTAPKSTEVRLNDIEKRLAALEANKCEVRDAVQKCFNDCKIPTQQEARAWIKENPFLALGIAVLTTALIVLILF